MANFVLEYENGSDDGIKTIYKDGVPFRKGVRLEMPQSIVQTYFTSAAVNLSQMTLDEESWQKNRHFGLQSFLMSLAGLEAFLNVHFHMLGREKELPEVIKATTIARSPVDRKIDNLSYACYKKYIPDRKVINDRIHRLYKMRSDIVHAKWEPSSLDMAGLTIEGMVDNFQQAFENRVFCQDSLRWCLIVIARVGILQWPSNPDAFILRWTNLNETNASLSHALGIAEDGN